MRITNQDLKVGWCWWWWW